MASRTPATGKPRNGHRPSAGNDPQADLVAIAAEGDRRELINAMLVFLAGKLPEAKAYEAAQITGRMQSLVKDRDELPKPQKVSVADDLAARRKERRAATQAAALAAGDGH